MRRGDRHRKHARAFQAQRRRRFNEVQYMHLLRPRITEDLPRYARYNPEPDSRKFRQDAGRLEALVHTSPHSRCSRLVACKLWVGGFSKLVSDRAAAPWLPGRPPWCRRFGLASKNATRTTPIAAKRPCAIAAFIFGRFCSPMPERRVAAGPQLAGGEHEPTPPAAGSAAQEGRGSSCTSSPTVE